MIILSRRPRQHNCAWQAVGLFGLGTVGRAIQEAIEPDPAIPPMSMPFDWADAASRVRHADAIAAQLQKYCESRNGHGRIDLVWSAGRAGMMTTAQETPAELSAFRDFLSIGEDLLARAPGTPVNYHIVSSAGALFEGQRWVGPDTPARPQLPYGVLKYDQEQLLSGLPPAASAIVYRPSSVYGYLGRGTRLGLIPVLIKNTFEGRMSFIFARADSIRDYVLAADVGFFIASQLDCPPGTRAAHLLASARPASIFEIASRIGRILRRKPFLRFATQHANASDNSYLPSALPAAWRPTPLDSGLRLTARQIIGAQQPLRLGPGTAELMAH